MSTKKPSRHEKPQRKNPNKMTVNQHIISKKYLSRWSDKSDCVFVFDNQEKKFKKMRPKSDFFCVMRLWDEGFETSHLQKIEREYYNEVKTIEANDTLPKDKIKEIINFYISIYIRLLFSCTFRKYSPQDVSIHTDDLRRDVSCMTGLFTLTAKNVNAGDNPSQDELEKNEKFITGEKVTILMGSTDQESQHLHRYAVSQWMKRMYIHFLQCLEGTTWQLMKSDKEQFILSDAFLKNHEEKFFFFPLTPHLAIIETETYEKLKKENNFSDDYINLKMKNNSIKFYIKAPELG